MAIIYKFSWAPHLDFLSPHLNFPGATSIPQRHSRNLKNACGAKISSRHTYSEILCTPLIGTNYSEAVFCWGRHSLAYFGARTTQAQFCWFLSLPEHKTQYPENPYLTNIVHPRRTFYIRIIVSIRLISGGYPPCLDIGFSTPAADPTWWISRRFTLVYTLQSVEEIHAACSSLSRVDVCGVDNN